ncbi:hypothetical protein K8Z61_17255 [Nocardioides sp. TRM66260-LWL]|uniref:hypothetical protein n=1 Tax=Nocardioides sp. TRM66260-LWL TaxID=2874478 RepID=UPI001CC5C4D9|nr:hypothetical protein [Nocardioides sp. TRM66260-LWL]MBZ5736244.1 hypothetical protein [Nocardioides sp. TRM66260-LWL]
MPAALSRVRLAVLSVLLCFLGLLVQVGPAEAVTYRTVTKTIRGVDSFYSTTFATCLEARYSAVMSARAYFANKKNNFDQPRISKMSLSVVTKRSCSSTRPTEARNRFDEISYSSLVYGQGCRSNPSFSASLPWSIGVAVTPTCGRVQRARFGDSQGRARGAHVFETTNVKTLAWNDTDTWTPRVPAAGTYAELCTSVAASVSIRNTTGTSRRKLTRSFVFKDACIRDR